MDKIDYIRRLRLKKLISNKLIQEEQNMDSLRKIREEIHQKQIINNYEKQHRMSIQKIISRYKIRNQHLHK